MTIQIPDDIARGLEGVAAAQQKSVEQVALDSLRSLSKGRLHLRPYCERFGNWHIQAPRPSLILRPRLPPHGCRCAIRVCQSLDQNSDSEPFFSMNSTTP